MKTPIPSEHIEQMTFVNWIKKESLNDPIYEMLFAIPNGGKRSKFTGANLKLEGLSPGVPDLMFAVARRGYHGLFIEMKRVKGAGLRTTQKEWFKRLQKQGYKCVMTRGAEAALKEILIYLGE